MKTSNAGYTLIELLVAMLLSGIALSLAAKDFSFTVHRRKDIEQVAEAQQAVSATLTFVGQELRQAGACLPTIGDFVALEGEDDGDRDSLTLRIGRTGDSSITCVRTVSTADARTGSSSIEVQNTQGFAAGQNVYVARMGGRGGTYRVSAVSESAISIEGSFAADVLVGSGVYSIEERTYTVDASGDVPILTVAIDGADPEPLASGVRVFDIRYQLDACPSCETMVDQPADNAAWRSVREIEIRVAAETKDALQGGKVHVVEETTNIKPPNLT
jgi:prepilin-type N-terminal cleavage/methylation domain-containing protein